MQLVPIFMILTTKNIWILLLVYQHAHLGINIRV